MAATSRLRLSPPAKPAEVAEAAPTPAPSTAPAAAAPVATATSTPVDLSSSSSSNSYAAIDSAEVVRRLKDATVFIKNKIDGKTIASGTGFVIEVCGPTVILATNRHVAVLDIDVEDLPAADRAEGKCRSSSRPFFAAAKGSRKRKHILPKFLPPIVRVTSATTWHF